MYHQGVLLWWKERKDRNGGRGQMEEKGSRGRRKK